jgi:hypothetical protein
MWKGIIYLSFNFNYINTNPKIRITAGERLILDYYHYKVDKKLMYVGLFVSIDS